MALADTARLIATLELQDKFSATAAKYDRTIGAMERRTSSLSRIGSETGRGLQNAATNIARAGVFAAGAITSQVVLGVRSLEQLATVTNQTSAAIESTGGAANVTADEVRALSESLEDLSTVDDKVIQDGANILLTFTKVRNEVGEGNDIFNQAVDAANNLSIALGTDMSSAALQVGKALNDPIRGVSALRRAGVQLTEQQEAQVKAFVESGDTLKAQQIILAELETQVGRSGEAFGRGPGAAMRRFGDAVEGAQQALATGFLPLIEKVSARVQEVLGNPEVLAQIKAFGEGAAAGIDDLIAIGTKLPWNAIADSFRVMGTGAKALLDAFTSLPPWVQTAVLTGWGLNKLTGGALGNIVGELGKGLIKGVLNMNAGVVNVNAKTVTGGPGGIGGPGGGGLRGLATGALATAGAAAVAGGGFLATEDIEKALASGSEEGILAGAATFWGGPGALITRAIKDLLPPSKEAATAGKAIQRIAQTADANEGRRAAAAAQRLADIRREQATSNAKLEAIRQKRSSFNTHVTVNTTTNVAFSATAASVQLARVSQSIGSDFRQDLVAGVQ